MARVPALIIMHGNVAQELVAAAQRVMGCELEDVDTMSNADASARALEADIEARVSRWIAGGIVFTDFWGGSCHICGMSVARRHPEIVIMTGLNVPMLLDYLHNRETLGVQELAERLQRKGQDGIRIVPGPPA